MTTLSDTTLSDAPGAAPARVAALPWSRLFYWTVRRELWEVRSIYIAPLIAAGVVLFGALLGAAHFSHMIRSMADQDPRFVLAIFLGPSVLAAVAIVITVLIVAVFYCLGALHNERRDRSILFWKSLPVSDLITVLAKASVPLVVMPVVTLVVILITSAVILSLSFAILVASGVNSGPMLSQAPSLGQVLALPYALIVLSLWYAPIAGWLLLVSGWARRAPFLWAVLPPLALGLVEKIAFGSGYVGEMIRYRLSGGLAEAFHVSDQSGPHSMQLGGMDPLKFAECPGLWIGLAFAAAFIAAAVWMRRYREPI
jgi:ABC-2 type transport system permease protein